MNTYHVLDDGDKYLVCRPDKTVLATCETLENALEVLEAIQNSVRYDELKSDTQELAKVLDSIRKRMPDAWRG